METHHVPKGRILCTEDDPDSRAMLVILLEHRGYDVTVTASAEHALAIAQREQFDLFLVDNWMSGLSGRDLTREVRKFNQTTPILFYSGAVYPADIEMARSAGAQGYLQKPCSPEALIEEIMKLTRDRKQ